ncbi:YgaP family membrane protein [Kaarinaea lacus]
MSERTFRLILGSSLLVLINIDYKPLFYVYLFVLFFEGFTNWRIPILVNRIRYGQDYLTNQPAPENQNARINFEAERAMRLVFGAVLIPAIFLLPRDLWFINWIIASFLTLAGLVNFCPTVVSLRYLGFK